MVFSIVPIIDNEDFKVDRRPPKPRPRRIRR
jgi:hypothetical protein